MVFITLALNKNNIVKVSIAVFISLYTAKTKQ